MMTVLLLSVPAARWPAETALEHGAWVLGLTWAVLCCAVLCAVDVREHRLPNRWTLRLGAGGLLTAATLSVLQAQWAPLAGAVLGGLGCGAVFLALHVLSRGGFGMGDVKLAAALGAYTGAAGLGVSIVAMVGAVVLGGLVSVVLVVLRRASARTAVPFGPALVAGAAGALVLLALGGPGPETTAAPPPPVGEGAGPTS